MNVVDEPMHHIVIGPIVNWTNECENKTKRKYFYRDYLTIVSKDRRKLFEDQLFENVDVERNPFSILILRE